MRVALVILALLACAKDGSITADAACLSEAISVDARLNLTMSGMSMPVGVWQGCWTSAKIISEMFKIVLEEVVGYNAVFSGEGCSSITAVYAIAGCTDPAAASAAARGCGATWSKSHVMLEFYPSSKEALQEFQKQNPQLAPVKVGDVGYSGIEGLYVKQSTVVNAASAEGLQLEFYRSYDVVKGANARLYFDKVTDLNAATPDFKLCSDASSNFADASFAEAYLAATGDAGGVNIDVNGTVQSIKCDYANMFFLSPACRSSVSTCIPVLTGSYGYQVESFMQKAVAFDMPLAIGVVQDLTLLESYARTHNVLYYWFEPDTTFINDDTLQIFFPEGNWQEWDAGIKTSEQPALELSSWAHKDLLKIAPSVQFLVSKTQVIQADMNEILKTLVDNQASVLSGTADVGSDSIYNLSCTWLKQNREVWKVWSEDSTSCLEGTGLVDSNGAWVPNRSMAMQCKMCPAGTSSAEYIDTQGRTYICQDCPAGTRQPQTGQFKCLPCEPGQFSEATKSLQCTLCPRGKYQSAGGQSTCSACPTPMTSTRAASLAESECVCPAGMYKPCKNPVDGRLRQECKCQPTMYTPVEATNNVNDTLSCLPCPRVGSICKEASDEVYLPCSDEDPGLSASGEYPKPLKGYYARYQRPVETYLCQRESSCPGGDIQVCAPGKRGMACGMCEVDHWMDNRGECWPCTDGESSVLVYPGIPLMFIPFLIVGLQSFWQNPVEKWGDLSNSLISAAYVGLVGIQTMGTAVFIFSSMPEIIQDAVGWSYFVWQLPESINVACSFGEDFKNGFFFKLSLPFLVMGIFFGTWCLAYATRFRLNGDVVMGMYGGGYRFCFIGIVAQCFSLFQVYSHPNGSSSMRTASFTTTNSQDWSDIFPIAGCAIMVNCCFALALFTFILCIAPSQFTKLSFRRRWKFLLVHTRPSVHWWIITKLWKGVYLALTSVLFTYPSSQVMWLCFGAVSYVSGCFALMPWRKMMICWLDILIHVASMFVFLIMPNFFQINATEKEQVLGTYVSLSGAIAAAGVFGILAVLIIGSGRMVRWNRQKMKQDAAAIVDTLSEMNSKKAMVEMLCELPVVDTILLSNTAKLINTEVFAKRQSGRLQWRSEPLMTNKPDPGRLRDAKWVWM